MPILIDSDYSNRFIRQLVVSILVPLYFFLSFNTYAGGLTLPADSLGSSRLHEAYQNQLVKAHQEAIIGYKSGLMSKAAYQKFGLAEPITGVFEADSAKTNAADFVVDVDKKLMIELELAYRLKRDIHMPVAAHSLLNVIDAVAPAIEIPNLAGHSSQSRGEDLIRRNVYAHQFIIGDWKALSSLSFSQLDQMPVALYCRQKLQSSGTPANALEGQQTALIWMINHLLKLGFPLQKGHILLTGNLINMTPLAPCLFKAQFDELGQVEFTAKPPKTALQH